MNKTTSIILFAILGVVGFFFFSLMHEAVHVQIYHYYGADARIELFSHFPNFVTISEMGCPNEECNQLQMLNEIVTYNLEALYFLIFCGFLCLIARGED